MLDTLHPAVLDRMEIIEIAGYTHQEKRHIMDKYLLPNAIMNAGLSPHVNQFKISSAIRDYIINNYAREAGVRSLKKFTNRIMEKIAYEIVEREDPNFKVELNEEIVQNYIGNPIFGSKRIYTDTPPGVVIGLAYN